MNMKELDIKDCENVTGGFWLNIFRSEKLGETRNEQTGHDSVTKVSSTGGTHYIDDGKSCRKI